jgi:hypothetical protein
MRESEVEMAGVDLIVAALAAGASAGEGSTATSAIEDANAGLKGLLARRLTGRPGAQQSLMSCATEPAAWQRMIGDDVAASGAADDARVLQVAETLLRLTKAA